MWLCQYHNETIACNMPVDFAITIGNRGIRIPRNLILQVNQKFFEFKKKEYRDRQHA